MKSGFFLLFLALLLSSCATAPPAGPAEKLGREIDQSMDRARKDASVALKDASRQVDQTAFNVGEFLEKTGQNIQRGTFW